MGGGALSEFGNRTLDRRRAYAPISIMRRVDLPEFKESKFRANPLARFDEPSALAHGGEGTAHHAKERRVSDAFG
jgi:hypothetical protein